MLAWALWDTGAAGVSAIVVTFVFSVYLTGTVGKGLPGGVPPASWLGRALAIAGLTIARAGAGDRRVGRGSTAAARRLTVLTGMVVGLVSAMSLIRDRPEYLLAGIGVARLPLRRAAIWPASRITRCCASSRRRRTPAGSPASAWRRHLSAASCCCWSCISAVIAGKGATRGFLQLPVGDGMNVRTAMLIAAGWFVVFATPLLLTAHRLPSPAEVVGPARGVLGGYRKLWSDLVAEWHRDRNLVYYLIASAVFRDGLAGVFTFGGVLGVNAYGISPADVLIFGIAASVVAALGAVFGGFLDDRVGSKPVIIGSLASHHRVRARHDGLVRSPRVLGNCGLLLCLFIGPAQASARTLLLRMSSHGKEGVAFGLYTMTGRAVSFVAPWLFSVFVDVFGAVRAGMGGLCLVMGVGLLVLLMVRVPPRMLAAGAD